MREYPMVGYQNRTPGVPEFLSKVRRFIKANEILYINQSKIIILV